MPVASRRSISAVLLAFAGLATLVPAAALRAQDAVHGQALVSVLGKDDVPVTGLTAKDFMVREDNASREILSLTGGAGPTHIALLVDDSQANTDAMSFVRDGLKTFLSGVAAHAPAPQIRITTFGDRPTLRQEFSSAAPALARAATRLFPQTGAGSRLLDAISETCRDLKTRQIARAAIVVIVNEAGPEFSEESHTRIEEELQSTGASLWAIVLHSARPADDSIEGRERNIVLGDATRDSGGLSKTVLGPPSVGPALGSVAAALTSQYAITYGRPDRLIPATHLTVETTDRSQKVLVRRWATR